ncbi:DUF4329 domain-containing protein [Hellea balneolensis]|uniref:DUF4329 domain-containing protein n=1 Tax=Hellea balneolensis TaxID=287478 RepID=UPI000688A6A4|nr:DUF4329 domain-containing protein [Hellea balneolensis]
MRFLFSLGAVLILFSGCASSELSDIPFERAVPQTEREIDFAKSTLEVLQDRSFDKNREYCGYIGITAEGAYVASPPKKGRKGSCRPRAVREDFRTLASYHTHGAFSQDYDSEIPSTDDLLSDMEEGIDGYVATPGGRIWFINAKAERAVLLCGENCVTSDPDYDPRDSLSIASEYSLEALIELDKE